MNDNELRIIQKLLYVKVQDIIRPLIFPGIYTTITTFLTGNRNIKKPILTQHLSSKCFQLKLYNL